jgi:5'-3' exonuclease
MANNYILIDGSYFIFYRYYALNIWWGHQAMGGDPPTPQSQMELPQVELLTEETISKSTYSVGGDPSVAPAPTPQSPTHGGSGQVQQMGLPLEELPQPKSHGGSGGLPLELIEKFKSTFVSKIHDIDKKLKLKNTIKYVGKDCRRSDIWRTALYPEYKATRGTSNDFLGASLFDIAYGDTVTIPPTASISTGGDAPLLPTASGIADENLFMTAGVKQLLSYPSLEADDCIALTAKHLYATEPDAHIWIIASDMDYLQITNDRIHLYDLKFKNICEKSSGNPSCDLFCKIVAGDKSDNIPSVFKKCGIKTAQKYFNDRELFLKKLAADKEAQAVYKLNTTLVDFNCIPAELVEGYMQMYLSTI